jgi:hypothetical protein
VTIFSNVFDLVERAGMAQLASSALTLRRRSEMEGLLPWRGQTNEVGQADRGSGGFVMHVWDVAGNWTAILFGSCRIWNDGPSCV